MTVANGLTCLTLNPAPTLERFRVQQARRDQAIQADLARRLYLASAHQKTRTQSASSSHSSAPR